MGVAHHAINWERVERNDSCHNLVRLDAGSFFCWRPYSLDLQPERSPGVEEVSPASKSPKVLGSAHRVEMKAEGIQLWKKCVRYDLPYWN